MTRERTPKWVFLPLLLLCVSTLSCRNIRTTRPYHEPPPPDIKPTIIDYVESNAFDTLFESALTNQDPVIVIQTDTSRPDWGPRLNAWIAAWNRGGKVVDEARRKVRMQAPLGALAPTAINGETVREFRLLIDDLMTRVEEAARRGSSWWSEERTQRGRIALLKPYSLRFHLDENQQIQLIFFNGRYSRYYTELMESMAVRVREEPDEWCRDVKCSCCPERRTGTTAQRTRVRSEREEPMQE
ncbi:MAG TPA: hypothetical protein VN688_28965 [Gemmataceae bacterium]|nr:hypothetical protein [Gemmataceae bacterium]